MRVAHPTQLIKEIDVLWITAGLSCDGDTIAITAATQPSLEDIVMGGIPGIPKVNFHNPFLAYENGDEFMDFFHRAAEGRLEPYILVVEGSIPNEENKKEGYWASFGTDRKTGQPITTCEWIDRLAPAPGQSSPQAHVRLTAGFMQWRESDRMHGTRRTILAGIGNRKAGCPSSVYQVVRCFQTTFMETLLYLLYQSAGRSPMIPLDEALRPTWLFSQTVHEGCDRGGYYEQAQFAEEYGARECIVKLGCWGPVVQCNVGKRGWINGLGGCPNVGGICIGCTMPGFPDKFMPFMDQPPGSLLSSKAVMTYGKAIHALRRFTQASLNKEPSWRRRPQKVVVE